MGTYALPEHTMTLSELGYIDHTSLLSLKVLGIALFPRFPLRSNEKPRLGVYLPYRERKTVKNTKGKGLKSVKTAGNPDGGSCYGGFSGVHWAFTIKSSLGG